MTIAAVLLAALGGGVLVLVVGLLMPAPQLNMDRVFDDGPDDPAQPAAYVGKRRAMEDGPTTYLGDSLIRQPWS